MPAMLMHISATTEQLERADVLVEFLQARRPDADTVQRHSGALLSQ